MAFVQSKSLGTDLTATTTIAVTLAAAVGNRNLVCGIVAWNSGVSTDLSSVSDDKGNAYTIQRTVNDTVNGNSAAVFFLSNITNAPITVTATFASAQSFRGISVHEVAGFNVLDVETGRLQSPGVALTTDAMTSLSVTTTVPGDYIFGAITATFGTQVTPNWTAGTGFTKREETSNADGSLRSVATEDQIQANAGAIAATFTQGNNTDPGAVFIMAFKPAASVAQQIGALIQACGAPSAVSVSG